MMIGLDQPYDLKSIVLSNAAFGPQEIRTINRAVSENYGYFSLLRDAVNELEARPDRTPASAVRLGVCCFLLGRNQDAIQILSNSDGGALAHFYMGLARFELGDFTGAIANFDAAAKAGYPSDDCSLKKAESLRYMGQTQQSLHVLDQMFGPVEQTAEYLYQRGSTVAAVGGNPNEVVALFERAVHMDGRHCGALFGLAMESDRRGNDESALNLYQRAADCFPTHIGALLNLGLLYEDTAQYERAQLCYQRILDVQPTNERAMLFFKDASASSNMLYDESERKRHDRLAQILNIPVSDFELSVRSRNCLQKMGVRTLGDLTRTTEADLLASKNFGETSLAEIRDMLASKGLELGQFAHERVELEPVYDAGSVSPEMQAIMMRPISDLNLSVRARKCMVRLGLTCIGELVRKSGDDLLECKNFGVTSLNEVREKLGQYGLKLRGE